jgi:hypothetical protein
MTRDGRAPAHLGYPGRVSGRLRIWIALALACLWPAQAMAAIPNGQTTDPLERGVLLSLGSIFRVETTVSVSALRTGTGTTYPLGHIHTVTLLGTAFAVAPTGVLVTDAHVAAPFGAPLAVAAAPLALAQLGEFGQEPAYQAWVDANNVTPVGVHVIGMRVWRATADPKAQGTPIPARIIGGSVKQNADLALLQLSDPAVPALLLNDGSETLETPIASLGYGVGTATTLGLPTTLVPDVKLGQIGPTNTKPVKAAPGQTVTYISSPISRGDSGGPVIDQTPRVYGIVRFQYLSGGVLEQSQAIADLLGRMHVKNANGTVFNEFKLGMNDLWSGNYVGAQAAFAATLRDDPTHPLAAQEALLATRLAHAKPAAGRPAWWRVLFVGIAFIAALATLLCVWRLRRLGRVRDGHDDTAPQLPPAQ